MIKWVFSLFFPSLVTASFVGNPASAGLLQTGLFSVHNYLINISSGYIYDITWDKKLLPTCGEIEKMKEFRIESNWSAFSVTILRRLSFYTYLGISKERMQWDSFYEEKKDSILHTKNHFSYSIGTKVLLLQFLNTKIAFDLQYFSLPSTETLVQKLGSLYTIWNTSDPYLSIEETHIALGVTQSLGPLSAYIGGKYSDKNICVSSENKENPLLFSERYPIGFFTGLSLNFSRGFYAGLEARFLDEYAISFTAIGSF